MQALSALPALPQLPMVAAPFSVPQQQQQQPAAPLLPPFLTIPAADAAKVTLNPNDCHRLGAFPYFKENINGFFVRLRMDSKSDKYIWARIVSGVTIDNLAALGLVGAIGGSDISTSLSYSAIPPEDEAAASMSPEVTKSAEAMAWLNLPSVWRRRLIDEPTFEWREKRYELYLICEHPFAAGVNSGVAGGDDAPANLTFLASFRQLGKEAAPSQEEVDAYCAQFVPIEAASPAAAATTDAALTASPSLSSPFAGAQQHDALSYVPAAFNKAFLSLPAQSQQEAELERLEARIQERVGKSKATRKDNKSNDRNGGGAGVLPTPAAAADGDAAAAAPVVAVLPHSGPAAAAAAKWSKFFEKNVLHRSLDKEDASKVVAANTRLNNVAGNAVIRSAVLYNVNLARAAQIEAARRLVEKSQSQEIKAANKALSRQSLAETNIHNLGGPSSSSASFPMATQLGSSSQNVDGSDEADAELAAAGGSSSLLQSAAGADAAGNPLDIDTLIRAALGPTASQSQLTEIRGTILASQGGSASPAAVGGARGSSVGSDASSVANAAQNMMVLLTAEELAALEADDQQFNNYINHDARRKGLDVLANVTTRNTKVNVGLRLQGYKLMAERDIEYEAEDDTMQPMWHTDYARRVEEAEKYANKTSDAGAKKDEAKVNDGRTKITEETEVAVYAAEAARVNAVVLARQGSTTSSSSSLQRANSASAAAGSAMLGAGDDLDDLLTLTKKVRVESVDAVNNSLVRGVSVLSQDQRVSVSESLGRVPIVASVLKRDRE